MSLSATTTSPGLPGLIDDRQNGFLRPRLGLEHTLDLEAAACALADQGTIALAVHLIDLEAAFPGASHRVLFKRLRRLGDNHPFVNIILDIMRPRHLSLSAAESSLVSQSLVGSGEDALSPAPS